MSRLNHVLYAITTLAALLSAWWQPEQADQTLQQTTRLVSSLDPRFASADAR